VAGAILSRARLKETPTDSTPRHAWDVCTPRRPVAEPRAHVLNILGAHMRKQAAGSSAHLLEGEGHMAHYLFQGGYAPEAWAGLMENPEDRTAVVRAAMESIGGKLEAL
jgi:hypothetical protein